MKKGIIVGATSGIGKEVAIILLQKGWKLGLAGRRVEILEKLKKQYPQQIEIEAIDVTHADAQEKLYALIEKMGGMDLYFHTAGVGKQNPELEIQPEMDTLCTNGEGFVRMITAVYRYFRIQKGGHIAAISSVAGTKGMGMAPAYSATKRFQSTYIQALSQLSYMQKEKIIFTDIRPGFVATPLLKDGNYPMLMQPNYVATRIVKALENKKRVAVIDFRYAILVFFWRLIPGFIWERIPVKMKKKA